MEFLIWSNQHKMWWRPGRNGYTTLISSAGRYTFEDAVEIVVNANWNINKDKTDVVEPDETIVPIEK